MVEKSADIAGCPDAVAGQLRRAVGATAMGARRPPLLVRRALNGLADRAGPPGAPGGPERSRSLP